MDVSSNTLCTADYPDGYVDCGGVRMNLEDLLEMVEDIPNGTNAEIIIDDVIAQAELAVEYIKLDGFNSKGVPILRIGVA